MEGEQRELWLFNSTLLRKEVCSLGWYESETLCMHVPICCTVLLKVMYAAQIISNLQYARCVVAAFPNMHCMFAIADIIAVEARWQTHPVSALLDADRTGLCAICCRMACLGQYAALSMLSPSHGCRRARRLKQQS